MTTAQVACRNSDVQNQVTPSPIRVNIGLRLSQQMIYQQQSLLKANNWPHRDLNSPNKSQHTATSPS